MTPVQCPSSILSQFLIYFTFNSKLKKIILLIFISQIKVATFVIIQITIDVLFLFRYALRLNNARYIRPELTKIYSFNKTKHLLLTIAYLFFR